MWILASGNAGTRTRNAPRPFPARLASLISFDVRSSPAISTDPAREPFASREPRTDPQHGDDRARRLPDGKARPIWLGLSWIRAHRYHR